MKQFLVRSSEVQAKHNLSKGCLNNIGCSYIIILCVLNIFFFATASDCNADTLGFSDAIPSVINPAVDHYWSDFNSRWYNFKFRDQIRYSFSDYSYHDRWHPVYGHFNVDTVLIRNFDFYLNEGLNMFFLVMHHCFT